MDSGNNVVAIFDHFLQVELVLIPGVEPLIPVPQGGLDAVCGRPVLLDRIPLDLWVKDSPEGVVVVLEGRDKVPDCLVPDLHLLLRHPLRSISAPTRT